MFANAVIAASVAWLSFGCGRTQPALKGVTHAWAWTMLLLSGASFLWFANQESAMSIVTLLAQVLFALVPSVALVALGRLLGRQAPPWLLWGLVSLVVLGAALVWLTGMPRFFVSVPFTLSLMVAMMWALAWMLLESGQKTTAYRLSLMVTLFTVAGLACVRLLAAGTGFHESLVPESTQILRSLMALAGTLFVTAGSISVFGLLEEQRHRHLSDETRRDALTGVWLRKPFFDRASAVIEQVRAPFAVILLDIDALNDINLRHGHAAGDRVIQDAAQVLKDCVRDADFIGRMGGGEFAIVLPRCGSAKAMAVAQRMKGQVAARLVPASRMADVRYTVSIGVASGRVLPSGLVALNAALQCASAALHAAKSAGKNKVVLHEEGPDPKNRDWSQPFQPTGPSTGNG